LKLNISFRKPSLITGAVLASLVLAACGSDPSTVDNASGGPAASNSAAAPAASYGPPAAGPHNAQDVTFVKDMLPHHSQAVEMADMALSRDTTPEVKALAQQIKGAQAPEISSMGGWLTGWGEKVPAADIMGGQGGMGAMSGGTGMMDAGQMQALDKATGTAFAKMWLVDMTGHHAGAVAMARTEAASGQSAEAKKLAGNIIASQTAEIAQMNKLLTGLA